MDLKIHKLAQR